MKTITEEKFLYCKTCGKMDRAWYMKPCNKRRVKEQVWKNLIYKNQIYFGYRLIECIKEGHVIQTPLTYLQVVKKLNQRRQHGNSRVTVSSWERLCRSLSVA